MMARIQKRDIPNTPHHCDKTTCVYNEAGICDEPRINRGNSDARCFHESNATTLRWLREMSTNDPRSKV